MNSWLPANQGLRSYIFQELTEFYWDLEEGDSDIAFSSPEFSGPSPNVTEHPLTEIVHEFLGEPVSLATEGPVLAKGDVLLFHLVEVSAKCDVGRDKVSHLFGRERGGVVGLVEDWTHWLLPDQAGADLADDFVEALVGVPGSYLLVLQQHGMFDWQEAFAGHEGVD